MGKRLDSDPTPWRWREGPVDRTPEHFELRYGELSPRESHDCISIALVSLSHEGSVNIEFLIDKADPRNANTINDVERELDFYVIELKEPDPWKYLRYHCATTSNLYSTVHWTFLAHSGPSDSTKT